MRPMGSFGKGMICCVLTLFEWNETNPMTDTGDDNESVMQQLNDRIKVNFNPNVGINVLKQSVKLGNSQSETIAILGEQFYGTTKIDTYYPDGTSQSQTDVFVPESSMSEK